MDQGDFPPNTPKATTRGHASLIAKDPQLARSQGRVHVEAASPVAPAWVDRPDTPTVSVSGSGLSGLARGAGGDGSAPPITLADELECDVCNKMFDDPVTLWCNHTMCRACSERRPGKILPQCPVCRTPGPAGAIETKPEMMLDNIVKRYKRTNVVEDSTSSVIESKCDLCDPANAGPAVVRCDRCDLNYCESCRGCHPIRGKLASHVLVAGTHLTPPLPLALRCFLCCLSFR